MIDLAVVCRVSTLAYITTLVSVHREQRHFSIQIR